MKLFYFCNYCESDFTLPYTAADRQELAQMTGEELQARCPSCGAFHEVHVNEIKARPRRKRYILTPFGFLAAGVSLYWFWQFYWEPSAVSSQSLLPTSGVILLISGAIFLIWRFFEKRAASTFNHRRYTRRRLHSAKD